MELLAKRSAPSRRPCVLLSELNLRVLAVIGVYFHDLRQSAPLRICTAKISVQRIQNVFNAGLFSPTIHELEPSLNLSLNITTQLDATTLYKG